MADYNVIVTAIVEGPEHTVVINGEYAGQHWHADCTICDWTWPGQEDSWLIDQAVGVSLRHVAPMLDLIEDLTHALTRADETVLMAGDAHEAMLMAGDE